ncbi:glycosyltransferase family 2 protein [Caproiciproducens sp. R1]|uniref:glycosyltransferase family 2 protein n=1 Tax=Caproiciproducens sp. R1 TaxID=3435000 RepID=UPI004033B574
MRQIKKVVVVVVTYNRRELLLQCIEKLLTQQKFACDVMVIDNASTDGTAEDIQQKSDPRLLYCNTGKNLGGAGGFNFGMRRAVEAGYDYIWIMDDDTMPEPDALAQLLAADEKLAGSYGFLSSRALWTDGGDCQMNLQRKTPYRDIDGFGRPLIPVVMASFVSLFLRADTIFQFGLPIKEFFIWSDDWEYTRRISRKLPCYAVTASRVVHAMKDQTVANIATDIPERLPRYRYFYRNDVYLYRREGLKGWLWLLAKDCWHSAQVVTKSHGCKWKKLRIIWSGFFHGIHFLKGNDDVLRF